MIRLSATAHIPARYVNRHTLITGPTGTGKTVSLLKLTESLAQAGVSVFLPDVKGDMGAATLQAPRIPIWAFGADLLARALELSEAQSGALAIAFAHADETRASLDTLQDLRALLATMASNPESVAHIGHISRASVGTIQRALLRLGDTDLFGASTFDSANLLSPGAVTILDATQLYQSPRLYGAFLLYLLRDLSRRLPECGDTDLPRLVLVFDEAHTVFNEASPALLRQVEASARLIRSKGVGLIWASQSPDDVPHIIRQQCATTIEHSRAHGVGRALFTTLDQSGKPTPPRMIQPDLPRQQRHAAPDPVQVTAPDLPRQQRHAAPDPVQVTAPDLSAHGYAFLAALAAAAFGLGYLIG